MQLELLGELNLIELQFGDGAPIQKARDDADRAHPNCKKRRSEEVAVVEARLHRLRLKFLKIITDAGIWPATRSTRCRATCKTRWSSAKCRSASPSRMLSP